MRKLVRKAATGQAIAPATTMQLDSSLLGLKNSLPGLMPTNQGNLQNISQGFNFGNFLNNIGSELSGGQGLGQSIGSGLSSALQGSKFASSGFSNFMGSAKGGLVTSAVNLATSFLPGHDYSGAKREGLAKGLDKGYDAVMSGAAMIPGVGTTVAGIMAANKFLSKGLDSLGVGTDRMCVCAGTKVYTSKGELVNIEELKQEQGILGWNEETKQIEPQEILNIITPTEKECLEITLKSGQILQCSIDHPILSDNNPKAKSKYKNGIRKAIRPWKFRQAQELKIGDFVGVANNIDYWGNDNLDNAYLVGLLIGDGTYTKGSSCILGSADQDIWNYIENNQLGILRPHYGKEKFRYTNKQFRRYLIYNGMQLMRNVGLVYQSGSNKTLPKNIYNYNKQSICELIAGLFDTDGSISIGSFKNPGVITFYQTNYRLISELQIQLHKLGIFSSINSRGPYDVIIEGKLRHSKKSYRLCIHDKKSILKFNELIPIKISYKKQNLQELIKKISNKKVHEHNLDSGAKQYKIVNIKYIGKQIVYNLTVGPNHTYLANNIITHNTTGDAILDSPFLKLTPLGLANAIGAKKSDTFEADKEANEQIGSSYSDSLAEFEDAGDVSGKKYGLLSRRQLRKANSQIAEAQRQQDIMTDIAQEAELDQLASNNPLLQNRLQISRTGGYQATAVGEKGMKLESNLYWARQLLSRMAKAQNTAQLYKDGGKMNIIPTGALHKELHHIDQDNITKKGIPVVTDNNGQIEQQAEIEKEEWILNAKQSNQIEELRDKYNASIDEQEKNQIAIEAGKIIVDELLYNTVDKGKLLKQVS